MKKALILLVMLAATFTAQAQHDAGDFSIQPRLGITISNLTDFDKSKVNFAYGVEFENYFTERFSLAAGLLFTNQGAKVNPTGANTEKTTLNIYYGTLPITANFYVLPGLALKAGLQPALRVKTKFKQGNATVDFDNYLDFYYGRDVKLNKFDLSVPVGLSYEIAGITLDARYNIGLTKIVSGADKSTFNKVFVITLGYKFGN